MDCLAGVLEEEIKLAREILENPDDKNLLKRYTFLQNGEAETLKNKCILKRWGKEKSKKAKPKHEHEVKPAQEKGPDPLTEAAPVKEPDLAKELNLAKELEKIKEKLVKEEQRAKLKQERPFEVVNRQPDPQPQSEDPAPQPEKLKAPKYFVNTFSVKRPDVDLLWNAEMVKNQAKQTIKNLKYLPRNYDPNYRAQKGFTIVKIQNPKCCGLKRSQATVEMESGSEKHIADAQQRLLSLQQLLKSADLMSEIAQVNQQNFHNNNYNNNINNNNIVPRYINDYQNEGDVVIIKEPNPFFNDKRINKKSYREFHYNVRTPVCYNSIIIQGAKENKKCTDEKTAKNPDKNNEGGVKRKRNARKFSGVNKKFYKSVRWKRKALNK